MCKKLYTLLLLSFLSSAMFAQNKPDTAFLLSATAHAKKSYAQWVGGHARLYNGIAHKQYVDEVEREAYLEPDWVDGSVFYDKELFENVALMYDMIADEVIVSNFYSRSEMVLISNKVEWFTIGSRKFVHLGRDKQEPVAGQGFYELLSDGEVKLYASKRKKIVETIVSYKIESSVDHNPTRYFIYKEGHYIPVNKKKTVLAALYDKQEELKNFGKKNNISFKNKETGIMQYVNHYNELHE